MNELDGYRKWYEKIGAEDRREGIIVTAAVVTLIGCVIGLVIEFLK